MTITPGQAQYVLTQLLDEHRISHRDISRALQHLHNEIRTSEERITALRDEHVTQPARAAGRVARRRLSPAVRAARKIQGRYVGHLRQVAPTKRSWFQRIAKTKGFPAAITALRKHLGK